MCREAQIHLEATRARNMMEEATTAMRTAASSSSDLKVSETLIEKAVVDKMNAEADAVRQSQETR